MNGVGRFKKGHIPWHKGKTGVYSEETKKKFRERTGEKNHNFMKPKSDETKKKMSAAQKGEKAFWFGKQLSEETKLKISNSNKLSQKKGIENSRWKGGKRVYKARIKARRRQMGFVCINQPFEGAEAHHIDRINVVFIPAELHKSIPHSQNNPETMEQINTKIFCWLLGR